MENIKVNPLIMPRLDKSVLAMSRQESMIFRAINNLVCIIPMFKL